MVRNYSDSQSSALCLTEHLPWNVSIESMLLRLMWHARGCDFSWRDAAIRVGNQEGCTGTGSVSAVSASKAIYTFTDPSSFISDCVCANGDALNAFYRAGSFTWWKYIIIHMIHIILWIGTFLVLGPLWLSTKSYHAEKVDILLLVWRLPLAFPPLADDTRSQPRCTFSFNSSISYGYWRIIAQANDIIVGKNNRHVLLLERFAAGKWILYFPHSCTMIWEGVCFPIQQQHDCLWSEVVRHHLYISSPLSLPQIDDSARLHTSKNCCDPHVAGLHGGSGLSAGLHGGSGESICHSVPAACLGPAYLR